VINLHDPKAYCETLRYSPCQNYLAVGSHDKHLYIYKIDADGKYTLHAWHNKHSSYVSAIDWTLDSTEVRSHSGDH